MLVYALQNRLSGDLVRKHAHGSISAFDRETGGNVASIHATLSLDVPGQRMALPAAAWTGAFMPLSDATPQEQRQAGVLLHPQPMGTLLLAGGGTTARFWDAIRTGALPISYILGNRDLSLGTVDFWRWVAQHTLQVQVNTPNRLLVEADICHEAWIIDSQRAALVQALLQAAGIARVPEQIPAAYADAQAQAQEIGQQVATVVAQMGAATSVEGAT